MNITQSEYLERLVNLLPDSAFVGKTKLVFDTNCVTHSAQMVETIAAEMFKTMENFTETDYIADLKDATRNLVVLGRFLTISYQTITGQS